MGTIVTVHGTFAQGPDIGSSWWQRTSHFEKELRDLVDATDGKLEFVPHGWDGLNSEKARRAAGSALLKRLQGLEATDQPYCIVAHSHGGSVVMHALDLGSRLERGLKGPSRWITVGTPFVSFRSVKLVLSRFGILGKAAYVLAMTLVLLYAFSQLTTDMEQLERMGWTAYIATPILFVIMVDRLFATVADILNSGFAGVLVEERRNRVLPTLSTAGSTFYMFVVALVMLLCLSMSRMEVDSTADKYLEIGIVVCLFIFFDVCVRLFVSRAYKRKRDLKKGLFERLTSNWTTFVHPHDEAVGGLRQLPRIRFEIFSRNFCVNHLTVTATLLLPIVVLLAHGSAAVMAWISAVTGLPVASSAERLVALVRWPAVAFDRSIDFSALSFPVAILLTLGPLALLCIAYVGFIKAVAYPVSWVLSFVLNHAAWNEVRSSSYGSDVVGETWNGAAHVPNMSLVRYTLPKDLASEITTAADSRALGVIRELRTSLGSLVFRGNGSNQSELLRKYLTGEELIHTSYFAVPRFNKLLAYSVSQSPGFRASARFLADPDYPLVAEWFRGLAETTPPRAELQAAKGGPVDLAAARTT
jgi:hypothetical protein